MYIYAFSAKNMSMIQFTQRKLTPKNLHENLRK